MLITMNPIREAEVYIHPAYLGESFPFPLREGRGKVGTVN
jgi:hypothetical protein